MTTGGVTTVRRRDLPERALLVGVEFDRKGELTLAERMAELRELAVSAGAEVVGEIRQRRGRPEPATLIGPGKVAEVAEARQRLAADVVIFDHDLTPAQQRNLERAIGGKVIDRTQLILDIFAARARTREGQLQVELAQLQYLLPRLAGMGEALSRLGGGIGTRGPGETRLEVDRRRIRRRITELRRLLAEVRRHRATQRKRRERTGVPVVALVGYTNAGKTTLQRALVAAYGDPRHLPPVGRDRLFDTLDPTVRRVHWPGVGPVLVSDTVGFIHDLPTHLIAAFRATLEEVADADVLLHVVDVSQPRWPADVRAVDRVLEEIGADRQPRVVVFNKIDRLDEPGASREPVRMNGTGTPPGPIAVGALAPAAGEVPTAGTGDSVTPAAPPGYTGQRVPVVRVSALTGAGLDELAGRVAEVLRQRYRRVVLAIPFDRASLLARVHAAGRVLEERATDRGWTIVADLPLAEAGRLEREGWVRDGVEAPAEMGENGGASR